MAKMKLSSFDPVNFVLIVRNADGSKINGTGSRGNVDYARKLAASYLRIDLTGAAASIDIYAYDPQISWQELQPLCTVTLDDEEGQR